MKQDKKQPEGKVHCPSNIHPHPRSLAHLASPGHVTSQGHHSVSFLLSGTWLSLLLQAHLHRLLLRDDVKIVFPLHPPLFQNPPASAFKVLVFWLQASTRICQFPSFTSHWAVSSCHLFLSHLTACPLLCLNGLYARYSA